jgi:hypothetical protein
MREFSKEWEKLIRRADYKMEKGRTGAKEGVKDFAGRLREKIERAKRKKL